LRNQFCFCILHVFLRNTCSTFFLCNSCRESRLEEPEPRRAEEADRGEGSDLESVSVTRSGKRGRRSLAIGRSEEAAAPPRNAKRSRPSAPTVAAAGDAEQVALTSPSSSKKVQGRMSDSGVMVSVKDGRVLSRHLELKKAYGTGHRNILNTNT